MVPGKQTISHLVGDGSGGGGGLGCRLGLELGCRLRLELGLGLAMGAQPHGGTGVVPGTHMIPHLKGSRLKVGVAIAKLIPSLPQGRSYRTCSGGCSRLSGRCDAQCPKPKCHKHA